ncbi:MAG: flap endonuclease [Cytophagaceae bacterium]|nr:flap endonuclease [Gemmatimonadaceae bacterium]
MLVHLIDGTYELFRLFYGLKRGTENEGPYAAVAGVLRTVVTMIEDGATHVGVATDHVIESFRNDLYAGYKTGDGIDPALFSQFHTLEDALQAIGVLTWPMVEFEADDALAAAAFRAAADPHVERVCIWTPDKDLAQCVVGDRVVQVDRRSKAIRNADAVREKFGVVPERIPDYLALVGDSADGYPGIAGIGAKTAARLINAHGAIEDFPADVLGAQKADALLFKRLATLRTDVPVFDDVDALRWRGPAPYFASVPASIIDERLAARIMTLGSR